MTTSRFAWQALQCLALAASLALTPGCEGDSPDTSELDSWFAEHPLVMNPSSSGSVVSISPDTATANVVGGQTLFTAIGGNAPYHWDVSNHALGSVHPTGKNQAIYTATALGDNNVIVYDEAGQAAVASISGSAPAPLTITASPSSTMTVNGSVITLTVNGGQAPYHWTVMDFLRGDLKNGNTGPTVVYQRYLNGDNVVTVIDGGGNSASLIISQP
jgi:hypothetical protein